MHIALTIAGSDSGGGAGLQADLKTFARFQLFGTSVVTAITAQNTRGVTAWEAVSPALIRAQLDAVADDLPPDGVKTGMLGDAAAVGAVVDGIVARGLTDRLVVDPVMISTSGDALSTDEAVAAIRNRLVPLARLVTPNLDEARVLLGRAVRTRDDMLEAATALVRTLGARAALVKGGHLTDETIVDVLYDGAQTTVFEQPRLSSSNTHGTGCTLSAAIAARLAHGDTLIDAVRTSVAYVHRAIASAPGLGSGFGPLNHFA